MLLGAYSFRTNGDVKPLPTRIHIKTRLRGDPVPTQEIPRQKILRSLKGDQVCFAEKDRDALEPIFVPAPANDALNYVCFAPALIMLVLLLVNFLFTGLASWVSKDEDREWWGRSAAWILITVFGWIVVNVIVLWGAQAIRRRRKSARSFSDT